MKEIIYIQAGNFSNYIGSHFWNTQESYFTYGEEDASIVDHDISFREGQNLKVSPCYQLQGHLPNYVLKGEPTFCPRLLLFDRKCTSSMTTNTLYLFSFLWL